MTPIDTVIPVYNGLNHVRECLQSVLLWRREGDRLIVVDDGSDPAVGRELELMLDGQPDVVLITKPENGGYLKAVNDGIARVEAPIMVLLNSDTIVFEGFYERTEQVFRENPDVGILNPVSVWANWTRIPFPPGQSIFSLHEIVRDGWTGEVTDIYNASGFCFAVGNGCREQLGSFDPAYDPGYWEETDYCMRALEAGFRVVCAQDLFVFHHGWASFGSEGRNENMKRNERLFRERWDETFTARTQWFRTSNPLRPQIEALEALGPADSNVLRRGDGPSVLYVIGSLKYYGGVISILQVVNELVLRGIPANVAVYGEIDEKVYRYSALYYRPLVFDSEEQLLESMPEVDVCVATHWTSVYTAVKLQARGRCRKLAYFVQDYEPDFYPTGTPEQKLARLSYDFIDHRICKTPWLKRILDELGGENHLIPLGLNIDAFKDFALRRRRQLITMARPSSARRNWPVTRRVLELLRERRPDIELAVFGHGYGDRDLPEGVRNYGLLEGASAVAAAMNDSIMLLDASTFQGFGRPGLEAMSCGTVAVLTCNGGITSYARHDHNCLLIDPEDVEGIVETVIRVFDDRALRERLVAAGLETASRYSVKLEGERTARMLRAFAPATES